MVKLIFRLRLRRSLSLQIKLTITSIHYKRSNGLHKPIKLDLRQPRHLRYKVLETNPKSPGNRSQKVLENPGNRP